MIVVCPLIMRFHNEIKILQYDGVKITFIYPCYSYGDSFVSGCIKHQSQPCHLSRDDDVVAAVSKIPYSTELRTLSFLLPKSNISKGGYS